MINISQLNFSRGSNKIFEEFNLSISDSGSTLLSGPNGSGKTTLLNLIGGILTPDSGTIFINDQKLSELTSKKQAALRSIAPQRRVFDLAFSVKDVLAIIKPKHRASHWQLVVENLDLNELMDKKITELSLGQQQRVSVALALIQEAYFYLLDEPFSAQDSQYSTRLLELLAILKKERGIFVISHNTDAVSANFDSIVSLA